MASLIFLPRTARTQVIPADFTVRRLTLIRWLIDVDIAVMHAI